MKLLLAVDGSRYSDMSAQMLKALSLSPQTEVTVMTVVPEHTYLGGVTLNKLMGSAEARERVHRAEEQKAAELMKKTVETLRDSNVKVESLVCWGKPAEEIVKQAQRMRADLVSIGAKGIDDPQRFPIGGTAQKVMKYADTSVLLVRENTAAIRQVMLATDGSRYSDAAVQFLLDLPLPRKSRVFVLTVLQSHIAPWIKMQALDLETNQKLMEELRAGEENAARSLMANTKKKFQRKGYHTESLLMRGEPAEEILRVAETLNPELIVLGAKGLTRVEDFLMGSVAQRVARFSMYSVLLVRPREG